MAKFKIKQTTTVAELKSQFSQEVGGVLRIYEGRSEASESATLVSLGANKKEWECRTSRTVGSFEQAFKNEFNLKVKVYTKDNLVKVLDDITLEKASKLPNGMTKAKMEAYVSNYATPNRQSKPKKEVKNEKVELPEEYKELPIIEIDIEEFCEEKKDAYSMEHPICIASFDNGKGDIVNWVRVDDYDFDSAYSEIEDCIDSGEYESHYSGEYTTKVLAATKVSAYGFGSMYWENVGRIIGTALNEFMNGGNHHYWSYEWFDYNPQKILFKVNDDIFVANGNGSIEMTSLSPEEFEILKHNQIKASLEDISFDDCNVTIIDTLSKALLVNADGDILEEYEDGDDFKEGLARVKQDGKWGFIDAKGTIVVEPKYEEADDFEEGLAKVQLDNKWGFIDKKGVVVVKPEYDMICYFCDGLARICKDYKWGFINTKGTVVVEPKYEEVDDFEEGLAKVGLDDKYGYIDTKGAFVIEPKYDRIYSFYEGFAQIKVKGKWGFVDKKGTVVVKPKYEDVDDFEEGLAKVQLDDKWGFIDTKGTVVIELKYEDVESFRNGYATVQLDGKWGAIDKSGAFVVEPKYDDAYDVEIE